MPQGNSGATDLTYTVNVLQCTTKVTPHEKLWSWLRQPLVQQHWNSYSNRARHACFQPSMRPFQPLQASSVQKIFKKEGICLYTEQLPG